MARVKVCGVMTVEQALECVALGVDAVGVNLVEGSPRRVSEERAAEIARAVGGRTLVGAVVAGLDVDEARGVAARTGVGCLQLHGDEPASVVEALLPHAYKAVRIAGQEDVVAAAGMPGEYVLVDTKVRGMLGGTGHAFEWGLVRALARARKLVLAGGLTPDNVAEAVRRVQPWCVDVASGVESAPGVKDMGKVRAFVAAAKA
jgi:phosphoribosylanthranilate isomerase